MYGVAQENVIGQMEHLVSTKHLRVDFLFIRHGDDLDSCGETNKLHNEQ